MAVSEGRRSVFPWVLWVLTLAAALAGAWLSRQKLERFDHDRDEALKNADELAVKVHDATLRLDLLNGQLIGLEAKNRDLTAKADELTGTLEEKQAELEQLTSTYRALEDKMQGEIKQGDVKLSQDNGRIQVDLVDKILFESGKSEVSPRGEEVLTRLGAVLATIDDKQIQVSGHTDDSPITRTDLKDRFATNWELSVARAVNVVRYLSEKAGVKPARLVAAGYGQNHPLLPNATPKGRAANRRIEILLLPVLSPHAARLQARDAGIATDGGH